MDKYEVQVRRICDKYGGDGCPKGYGTGYIYEWVDIDTFTEIMRGDDEVAEDAEELGVCNMANRDWNTKPYIITVSSYRDRAK